MSLTELLLATQDPRKNLTCDAGWVLVGVTRCSGGQRSRGDRFIDSIYKISVWFVLFGCPWWNKSSMGHVSKQLRNLWVVSKLNGARGRLFCPSKVSVSPEGSNMKLHPLVHTEIMVSDRHVWFPQLLEDFLFDSLILILAGTTQQQLFMCLFCTVVCVRQSTSEEVQGSLIHYSTKKCTKKTNFGQWIRWCLEDDFFRKLYFWPRGSQACQCFRSNSRQDSISIMLMITWVNFQQLRTYYIVNYTCIHLHMDFDSSDSA